MTDDILLKFSFNGGIADQHIMDFYETSRFHYGAARLLYTINHLSETGRVAEKITKRIYNQSFVIHPPKQGSWELIVLGYVGLKVADSVIQHSVDYVMHSLFPLKKKLDETSKLLEKAKLNSSSAQILTQRIQNARVEEQIEIADAAIRLVNDEVVDTKFEDDVNDLIHGLQQAARRFKNAGIYEAEMLPKKLSIEQKYLLIDKTRTLFKEIGYPLNKSADELNLTHVNDNDEKISNTIFIRDIESLAENIYEDEQHFINVKIKSFDKETGWLKVRLVGQSGTKGVRVRKSQRTEALFEILDAMKNDTVVISVYRVLKPVGSVAYYIFDEYLDP